MSLSEPISRELYEEVWLPFDPVKIVGERRGRGEATVLDENICEALAALTDRHDELKGELDQCRQIKLRQENMSAYDTAILNGRCEEADLLAEEYGFDAAQVDACRKEAERNSLLAELSTAMADLDCAEVARLETQLSRKDGTEQCKFNAAMAAGTPRAMYLAASRYDIEHDRARAKLIYVQLMDRFPEDDLALQAAMRLTTLTDLERSEQARREMEGELSRLKQQAEAAQRQAQEARRAAERAQTDAANQAAAVVRAKPQRSACAHVYRGKRVKMTPDAPGNAKQALGFIFQGGLYGTNFEVTGVGRSEATLYSLDTGRSLQVPCSKVP